MNIGQEEKGVRKSLLEMYCVNIALYVESLGLII